MLKRETIKQAIDAIAVRDPEIGYSLTELFGTGRIDVSRADQSTDDHARFYFTFDRQRVAVDKNSYFNEGLAAVEQPLLVKYGEMAQKLALEEAGGRADFTTAGRAIHDAGLGLLVGHEIKLAMAQLEAQRTGDEEDVGAAARSCLARLNEPSPGEGPPLRVDDPRVLFCGAVNADDPAYFTVFPFTRDALMQLADLQLPFFSVRFVLRSLLNGTSSNLFACLVAGKIAGLIFLRFRATTPLPKM